MLLPRAWRASLTILGHSRRPSLCQRSADLAEHLHPIAKRAFCPFCRLEQLELAEETKQNEYPSVRTAGHYLIQAKERAILVTYCFHRSEIAGRGWDASSRGSYD